jgi:hypothetical protein
MSATGEEYLASVTGKGKITDLCKIPKVKRLLPGAGKKDDANEKTYKYMCPWKFI